VEFQERFRACVGPETSALPVVEGFERIVVAAANRIEARSDIGGPGNTAAAVKTASGTGQLRTRHQCGYLQVHAVPETPRMIVLTVRRGHHNLIVDPVVVRRKCEAAFHCSFPYL
jgi:hypothetical protein